LTVNKGWLTNTGIIDGLVYGTLTADLDNRGIFNIAPNTSFTMDKSPQYILNSGDIHVSGGDYFKVTYLDSLVNTGTFTIDAGCTAKLYGTSAGISGIFPSPEATFTLEGSGVLSNAGTLDIKYLSVNLGPKWVVGSAENVTLHYSRVATDSLINEGYLTMKNASITGEVVNRDTLVAELYGAAFDSTLVNAAGAYIKADGTYSNSWTYFKVDSAFTNLGELELTATSETSKGVSVTVAAGNLVNSASGTINAGMGASTYATFEHKLSANLINQGAITLSAPTRLSRADAVHTNSGALQVDTTLTIAGSGTFTNLTGGLVSGQGTIDVTDTDVAFINAGTIAPGGSPGVLAVDGDLTLVESSVISIEIEGNEPGTGYDLLNITGNVALAGSLKVNLSYSPDEGKTFQPLIYGSSSGVFGSLTTQGGGKFLSSHITDTGVYLTASFSGENSWPFISRIADITAPEDSTLAITLQAFDPDEGNVLTFSASSDTPAVAVAIVADTLKITPELNWNGTAQIEVVVADLAGLKDTTAFALTLTPVQDAPLAFNLTAPAKDSTVVITLNNINTSLLLLWDQADDPEGDNVYYDVVFTDSLDIMPSKYIGRNPSVQWYLSDIKAVMETNGYPTITGTWTIYAYSGTDTTYAANGPLTLTFVNGTLGIAGGLGIPTEFALHQNHPNPFNPSTTLRFDLPEASNVTLTVYDLMGREVTRLVAGRLEPGYHAVVWNGRDRVGRQAPTGVYIARMVSAQYTRTIKLVLLK